MSGATIHELQRPFHLWVPHMNDYMHALFIFDYSIEEHVYWFGPMQKTGEFWMLDNSKVRADSNQTIGRVIAKDTWVQDKMPEQTAPLFEGQSQWRAEEKHVVGPHVWRPLSTVNDRCKVCGNPQLSNIHVPE